MAEITQFPREFNRKPFAWLDNRFLAILLLSLVVNVSFVYYMAESWQVMKFLDWTSEDIFEQIEDVELKVEDLMPRPVGTTDADDVLQDVLIQISRKLYWLRAPELFRPWAFRIASRAGVRNLKKNKRWTERSLDDSVIETMPARGLPIGDLTEMVFKSPALSNASRAVLVLHFLEKMTLHPT